MLGLQGVVVKAAIFFPMVDYVTYCEDGNPRAKIP